MEIFEWRQHKRDGRAEGDRSNGCARSPRSEIPAIAVLYFFLNSAGLPTGLFYTGILSPLFFLWLFRPGNGG